MTAQPRHPAAFALLLVAAAAALAVGCGATMMPRPTDLDAQAAKSRWPDVSTADLARGRDLYIARCSSCHQPVHPTSVPTEAWPGHVQEMAERAHLDAAEQHLVIAYVVTMSTPRAPAAPAAAPTSSR